MNIEDTIRTAVREVVREELRAALAELRPANDTPPGPLLTIADAAELAQVNPATVRSWIQSGNLPRLGSGRIWRVRREDLFALLARKPTGTFNPSDEEIERMAADRAAGKVVNIRR